jgi:hypothetical protein
MLTPREFTEQVEGFRWRDRRLQEHHAWVVAYLLQPYLPRGQTLTPAKLLQPTPALTVEEAVDIAYERQMRRDGHTA